MWIILFIVGVLFIARGSYLLGLSKMGEAYSEHLKHCVKDQSECLKISCEIRQSHEQIAEMLEHAEKINTALRKEVYSLRFENMKLKGKMKE